MMKVLVFVATKHEISYLDVSVALFFAYGNSFSLPVIII